MCSGYERKPATGVEPPGPGAPRRNRSGGLEAARRHRGPDRGFLLGREGELFFVIGGSGCGKSTLLRHLIGLQKPARGTVRYGGEDFTNADLAARRNLLKTFGVLYQNAALWSSMTLRENVVLPLEQYTTLNRREREEIVS